MAPANTEIQRVGRLIASAVGDAGRVTILTGAGISAESGIPTFREAGGIWEKHRLEDVATPQGFAANPQLVLDFYNARRRQIHEVQPNAGHVAIGELERAIGDHLTLITQNIDDLHERGGAERVYHMHGELLKARCVNCESVTECTSDINVGDSCPCGGQLRPHIVWFGELPFYYDEVIPRALSAEVFIAIGTSGVVQPAAAMVWDARRLGATTVEVNLEPGENTGFFEHRLIGPAGEILPELVATITEAG